MNRVLPTFANIANATSVFVTRGSTATATLALFPGSSSNGNYHWQYRIVASSTGDASLWQPFSGNATNFIIDTIPLYTQVTSTYPSLSATTGTTWWAPQLLDGIATNTIAGFGCLITSVTMDLRSYGITTTTMQSYMSSTDVNPANLNDWLEMANSSGTGYSPPGSGEMNWQDIPYYSETPSGTFRAWYNVTTDHVSSASTTWVNGWLNYSPTETVPVILTEGLVSGVEHFVVATGNAINNATTTYTIRDPYFYNTQYLNQTSGGDFHNYSNTFSNANVLEAISSTSLPLYLEYAIDSAHTLLITDANGNRLGIDSATGISYDNIPNSGEDDEQDVRFLTIYTPAAGQYSLTVHGSGPYHLGMS